MPWRRRQSVFHFLLILYRSTGLRFPGRLRSLCSICLDLFGKAKGAPRTRLQPRETTARPLHSPPVQPLPLQESSIHHSKQRRPHPVTSYNGSASRQMVSYWARLSVLPGACAMPCRPRVLCMDFVVICVEGHASMLICHDMLPDGPDRILSIVKHTGESCGGGCLEPGSFLKGKRERGRSQSASTSAYSCQRANAQKSGKVSIGWLARERDGECYLPSLQVFFPPSSSTAAPLCPIRVAACLLGLVP